PCARPPQGDVGFVVCNVRWIPAHARGLSSGRASSGPGDARPRHNDKCSTYFFCLAAHVGRRHVLHAHNIDPAPSAMIMSPGFWSLLQALSHVASIVIASVCATAAVYYYASVQSDQ